MHSKRSQLSLAVQKCHLGLMAASALFRFVVRGRCFGEKEEGGEARKKGQKRRVTEA